MRLGNQARNLHELVERLEREHGAEYEQFQREYPEFFGPDGLILDRDARNKGTTSGDAGAEVASEATMDDVVGQENVPDRP